MGRRRNKDADKLYDGRDFAARQKEAWRAQNAKCASRARIVIELVLTGLLLLIFAAVAIARLIK